MQKRPLSAGVRKIPFSGSQGEPLKRHNIMTRKITDGKDSHREVPMSHKLLVVDDEPDITQTIKKILVSEGFIVETASNGEDALRCLSNASFDLVITDLRMPGLDGFDLIRKIKEIDEDIEAIVLTGHATLENAIDALRLGGVFDYLTKPLEDIDDLLNTVRQALEKRALRKENKALLLELEDRVLKRTIELSEANRRLKAGIIEKENATVELEKYRLKLEQMVQERTEQLVQTNRSLQKEISKRKKKQLEVRRLNSAIEQSIDGIAVCDLKSEITYANKSFAAIHGRSTEEMIGLKLSKVSKKEKMRQFEDIINDISTHGSWQGERIHVRKNGDSFPAFLSATLFKDEDGDPSKIIIIVRDISGKKMLEDQLLRAQKLESIGTLSSGIAHNFNNILMGIIGNASLMLLNLDKTNVYYQYLKNIEQLVDSGSKLTWELLNYARKGKHEVRSVQLNHTAEKILDTFSQTKKEIRIHRELAENLWLISGDRGQIEQVLMNLFVNAADAMPAGGDLFIRTENVVHTGEKKTSYEVKPGKYVMLEVSDTGIGMKPETIERIFEPFFTTKEKTGGTGLGLSSVYGIVKSFGGYVDAESTLSKGTTFRIYLPSSHDEILCSNKVTIPIQRGKENILIVDDEEGILKVGSKLLTSLGYNVVEAKNGSEAIRAYEQQKESIDMVILDLIMPDMTGDVVYHRMKEVNPGVKVLLASGCGLNETSSVMLEKGCNGFIQKPYKLNELSNEIRTILDKTHREPRQKDNL
jgi:two-component system, cell cycle sensor histidine kinase and response regulator CckA